MKLSRSIVLSAVVCSVCVLFACTSKKAVAETAQSSNTKTVSPVAQNGKLQVIGTQLCNQKGDPVSLRGTSFGWSNEWDAYYTKENVNWLVKDWKVSLVRAAMSVGAEVKLDKDYLHNPDYAMKCVDRIVEQAIADGIYVIVDFHSHLLRTKEASVFFDTMSKKYKGCPNVIYEIFNEPIKQPWSDVKAYAETIIDIIRKNGADNVILVGTPHWCQDVHLAAADPIKNRSNIMYVMHFYAATHKKWLRDRTDNAIAQGLPVFVSECAGMEASGDGFLDVDEWNAYVNWMEKNKLSWACWSISPKVETCSMLVPGASTKGNWKETDIKPWGKIVKENVSRLNSK